MIIDWFSFLTDICAKHNGVLRKFGGQGITVESDEAYMVKIKKNGRGKGIKVKSETSQKDPAVFALFERGSD